MNKLLLRIGLSLLGCVGTLLWWTYHDKGSNAQSVSHIPAKIAAGGNQLEIFTDASTASTVRVSFEDIRKPAGEQILVESSEKISAGTHHWTVDVPSGIGGYIELNADHPNPGDILNAGVKINGSEISHHTDKLERAPEPNAAFFVQFHYDDFSKATAEPEEATQE
jgi:hypothetical protein